MINAVVDVVVVVVVVVGAVAFVVVCVVVVVVAFVDVTTGQFVAGAAHKQIAGAFAHPTKQLSLPV